MISIVRITCGVANWLKKEKTLSSMFRSFPSTTPFAKNANTKMEIRKSTPTSSTFNEINSIIFSFLLLIYFNTKLKNKIGATIACSKLTFKFFAMTFVLIIFDLKDIPENLQTQEINEYAPETINRAYPVATHEIVTRKYYDENYAKIKDAMLAKGYSDKAHTTKTQLPHNCLVKDNTSQQQAITDLIEVVKKYNAALQNYVAVTVTGSYQADASLL